MLFFFALGSGVSQGYLDQYSKDCSKEQPKRCRQKLVQPGTEPLGCLPDVQTASADEAHQIHASGLCAVSGPELADRLHPAFAGRLPWYSGLLGGHGVGR